MASQCRIGKFHIHVRSWLARWQKGKGNEREHEEQVRKGEIKRKKEEERRKKAEEGPEADEERWIGETVAGGR